MVSVIKANGEREQFDEQKVIDSIKRAGIPEYLSREVLTHVRSRLYPDIPTAEIYHHISEFLLRSENPYAQSRYSLKQAIMLLGPTGYPFEDFIATVLHAHGYHAKVRQILSGSCVNHEVDVIATKNGNASMVEVKFHNNPGVRSDVHVALYTKSRFEDVKTRHKLSDAWLVTNTKATTDAIAYAACVGMKVISWSYPEGNSLRDMIEQSRLHPITMLTTLSQAQKNTLLQNHIVMCKDILHNHLYLDMLHLPTDAKEKVIEEVTYICRQEHS
jgi:hypothetical protein